MQDCLDVISRLSDTDIVVSENGCYYRAKLTEINKSQKDELVSKTSGDSNVVINESDTNWYTNILYNLGYTITEVDEVLRCCKPRTVIIYRQIRQLQAVVNGITSQRVAPVNNITAQRVINRMLAMSVSKSPLSRYMIDFLESGRFDTEDANMLRFARGENVTVVTNMINKLLINNLKYTPRGNTCHLHLADVNVANNDAPVLGGLKFFPAQYKFTPTQLMYMKLRGWKLKDIPKSKLPLENNCLGLLNGAAKY